jgi:hypothetical protein
MIDNGALTLDVYAPDGDVDNNFSMFIIFERLQMVVRTAPFIDHYGNHRNECLQVLSNKSTVIPTDGEMNPTTLVEDVFYTLDEIFNELEIPDDHLPLQINKMGVNSDVAKRRLAGESIRQIVTDIMRSRIAYPSIEIPPFHIIKGK